MTEATTKLMIVGADPHNLAELADYQEGSVVSRTYIGMVGRYWDGLYSKEQLCGEPF